jgi:hypothetical protein
MRRRVGFDVLPCPRCGGRLRVIALIDQGAVTRRLAAWFLTRFGIPAVAVRARTFDIAPDGRRFLMITQGSGNEAAPRNLIVVQNWHEELKRLVPVS